MKEILIVAPPGRLQEGLQVLLATLPGATVSVAGDGATAAARMTPRPPHLVLIAGGDVAQTVTALRGAHPAPRYLVVAGKAGQKAAAAAAGADAVVVEGVPAKRLLAAAGALLAEPSADPKEVTS